MEPTFPLKHFLSSPLTSTTTTTTSHQQQQQQQQVYDSDDCQSSVSATTVQQQQQQQHSPRLFSVRLGETDVIHNLIKTRFLRGLGLFGTQTEVISIQRNACSDVVSQARLQSFLIYEAAVAKLRGGNPNVKYAWYGTCGEKDVRDIISHGFGLVHGNTLCLSPDDSPLQSVKNCVAGSDGLRHVLLCRVILGKTEVVESGTQQCYPSSEEFDSGVVLDSLSDPSTYVIWSFKMNTHVWPAYVISFKVTEERNEEKHFRPTSPWMPFPTLISVLSKVLSPSDVALVSKFYKAKKERRISRHELIQKVRQVAGDELLIAAIKSYRAKKKSLQTRSKIDSPAATMISFI